MNRGLTTFRYLYGTRHDERGGVAPGAEIVGEFRLCRE
jgi:hypothetical protein